MRCGVRGPRGFTRRPLVVYSAAATSLWTAPWASGPGRVPNWLNMPDVTPIAPPVDYSELAPRPPAGTIAFSAFGTHWAEIEIEIGFGRGMFLLQRAARVPTHLVLGFEVKKKLAYQVEQRRERLLLDNGRAFFADVRDVFPRLGPAGQVSRIFMHFPDPWWKKRHGKRRLVGDTLLSEVARLLRPGGEFFVQTDVNDRAEIHAQSLAAHAAFELAGDVGRILDNPYGAVSNREKRAGEDGLPVYRVLALRR